MNIPQKIARKILKQTFDLSVSTIEFFSKMGHYRQKVSELRKLEDGTLEKEIAECLDNHNLTLVPKY